MTGKEQCKDAETEALIRDANRWRAFVNMDSFRLFGAAGLNQHDSGSDYAHFGGEFWTGIPDDIPHHRNDDYRKSVLEGFADKAVAKQWDTLLNGVPQDLRTQMASSDSARRILERSVSNLLIRYIDRLSDPDESDDPLQGVVNQLLSEFESIPEIKKNSQNNNQS